MANSANLPAPYLGVNERDPVAAIKSPYCENLLNFNVTTAGISLRNGDSKFDWISPAASGSDALNMGFFPYGDTKLISPIKATGTGFIDFYDCESGVSGYTTINSVNTTAWSTVYFAGYLFFFPNTSTLAPGVYWSGSAYGVAGYTADTGNLWPIGGNSYKNRIYLIQLNEAAYWYPVGAVGINAISAVCTKINLAGLVEQNCTLSSIASFTLSDQTTTEEYQAFIMSNGEVLFYSGSYPDSPTWASRGKSKVGQPLYVGSTIKYQGDTLLMCDSGVISMRALFLAGAENAQNVAANTLMQTTWRTLVQAIRTTLTAPTGPIVPGLTNGTIRGVYDSKTDRVIISFPYQLNASGAAIAGSFYFVFYTPLQAWFYHQSTGDRIDDICVYKNGVRLLAQTINAGTGDLELMTYTKEGATGFQDRNSADTDDVNYTYEMLSAPIPFPKTAVYETDFIEPILESDLYAETNWNFVVDFGRQSSGDQKTDAATTSVAKPGVNVGMQNITYVQVKMSGTTAASKTVGLDLYSYNVWYDSGEKASR